MFQHVMGASGWATSCGEPEYTWIAHTAIAVGTFLAVFVALFGDWLKSQWFKPDIELQLRNPLGTYQQATIPTPEGTTKLVDTRYYHLVVVNKKRWPVATQVQVNLVQIEVPNAGGALVVKWSGDIPLRWRFQEIHPTTRAIGPDAECDFICVARDHSLSAQTMIIPINFPLYDCKPPIIGIIATVQARGAEADSAVKRFKISWDGKWADGEREMANHLVIEELRPPPSQELPIS